MTVSVARTPHDLQSYLTESQIQAELLHDVGETPTVPAAAAVLGVEADQIIKTLLFVVDPPAPAAAMPVVVISHGERRVDKKALAQYFGVGAKRVHFAPAEVVLELIGYPAGGVPPVGHKTAVPILLDASVVHAADQFGGILFGGGGDDRTMLRIALAELVRVTQPQIVALS